MRVKLTLEAELPGGVSCADFSSWVQDTIAAAPGGLMPDDPLFHLDRNSVRVSITEARVAPKSKTH